MPDVMENRSTVPRTATPIAWPTLRMVVWMPPDWAASRSFSTSATTLFAWELTTPAPVPASRKPTIMSGTFTVPTSMLKKNGTRAAMNTT